VKTVVFVDLDSTLADTTHRHHIIEAAREAGEVDLEAYSLACAEDAPFPGPVRLVRMLYDFGCRVVIVTGRSAAAMIPTLDWLAKYAVPYHDLILRAVGDDTPSGEFKVRTIRRWLAMNPDHDDLIEPALIIEDYPPAKDELEAEGWTVLLVNPDYSRATMKAEVRP
jgi:phosphoglycolate phosphatase-like HAD superfamily hydrolase